MISGFRGTSLEQDSRFQDKLAKEKKRMKFPPEFDLKIDMNKVNLEVLKPWIAKRITEILSTEDEILIDDVIGRLEDARKPTASFDPKNLQIYLTPFLDANAPVFTKELWELLVDAEKTVGGIPNILIQRTRDEIMKRRTDSERIQQGIQMQSSRDSNWRDTNRAPPAQIKQEEEEGPKYGLIQRGSRRSRSRSRSPRRRSHRSRSRSRSRSPRRRSHHSSSRRRSRSKSRSRSRSRSPRDRRRRDYSRDRSSRRKRSHSRSRSPRSSKRSRYSSRSRSPKKEQDLNNARLESLEKSLREAANREKEMSERGENASV